MKVSEMVARFKAHGVPDWMYTVGGLGGGEIDGIAQDENGAWITYYSERGSRHSIKHWPSEDDAVADLFEKVQKFAKYQGQWRELT